jgi:hypothetical protein
MIQRKENNMSPVLYSLLAIALVFAAIGVWAFRDGSEGWQVVSILIPICIGIFGFGMFGTIGTYRIESEPAKVYEVVRGKHIVVVCTDHKNITFEGYDVDNISDSSKFYWEIEINHYNYESGRTLKYK